MADYRRGQKTEIMARAGGCSFLGARKSCTIERDCPAKCTWFLHTT
jgi:hypothetical protein